MTASTDAGDRTAAWDGRAEMFALSAEVKAVAASVLRHRVVLKPAAELDGVQPDDVVARILANVPVPR